MFFANNRNGIRTYIGNALFNEVYYCPLCNGELIQKRGEYNAHHFAHKNMLKDGQSSCDGWSNDMSDWHMDWQNAFPEESREIVVERNGVRHRADVLVNNTVIEFQHSVISPEEFRKRNAFYSDAGYRVIWIFDMTESYAEKRIIPSADRSDTYTWKKPSKTLLGFDLKSSNIDLFFQLQEVYGDNYGLAKVIWIRNDFSSFRIDPELYMSQTEFVDYALNPLVREEGQKVLDIINACDANVIGIRNIKDGTKVKIGTRQYKNVVGKPSCIMGYYGKDYGGGYFGDRRVVKNADNPVWELEWKR